MHFKIKNTEFKISFTFFALVLILSCSNNFRMYLLTLFFGLMHELVHLFFICKFSTPPIAISFSVFGANITRGSNTALSNFEEFLINISAPFFNLILAFLVNFLPITPSVFLGEIIISNSLLGIFNILPFYNLDGGNALRYLLLFKLNKETTERILTITSIAITFAFSIATFLSYLKFRNNYSSILISVYFILLLLFKKS